MAVKSHLAAESTRGSVPTADSDVRMAAVADLPWLLTTTETATLLRTSRKAIYTMIERRLLPGVTRVGRRALIRRDVLLDWLRQKSAPSPQE